MPATPQNKVGKPVSAMTSSAEIMNDKLKEHGTQKKQNIQCMIQDKLAQKPVIQLKLRRIKRSDKVMKRLLKLKRYVGTRTRTHVTHQQLEKMPRDQDSGDPNLVIDKDLDIMEKEWLNWLTYIAGSDLPGRVFHPTRKYTKPQWAKWLRTLTHQGIAALLARSIPWSR